MTILVLNANGKVGQEVAKQLLAAKTKIRIGARDKESARKSFPGVEIASVDYSKPATLSAALKGIDTVFTATPYELLPQPELDLVVAAKAAGVKRIVKLSQIGADQDSSSPHAPVEMAIRESGLEYTFLRPTFFMQNYLFGLGAAIKPAGAIYEPAADGKSSFIDARDIAAVAVKAMTKPGHNGKGYLLTGGEAVDRNAVAAAISKAIGKPVAYVPVDDAALRDSMAGASPVLIELMSALYGYVRAGQTSAVSPDVETVLDRKPITFEAFAKDHAAFWM
jgi:uncharacterized protein YbjT (DUF2867 family)